MRKISLHLRKAHHLSIRGLLCLILLFISGVTFAQTLEEIGQKPFDYLGKTVAFRLENGSLKQTGLNEWEYTFFAGGRRMVVKMDAPGGESVQKYNAAVYCKVQEANKYQVVLVALGNAKNTNFEGGIDYRWKH